MKFRVTMKSGESGVPETSVEIEAPNEDEARAWGQVQMKRWGWTDGVVTGVLTRHEEPAQA